MADIIILIIIAGAAVIGYRKGLIRSVFNLGYHFVSLAAAAFSYPMVSKKLSETQLYDKISEYVTQKVSAGGFINTEALPEFMRQTAQAGIDAAVENTASSVTDLIVTIISVIIVFVVVKFVLGIASKTLNSFAKLPVIKGFNKLGGFVFGILSGVIIVYVVLAVAAMFPQSQITDFIAQGSFAQSMYNNNLIMKCIFK